MPIRNSVVYWQIWNWGKARKSYAPPFPSLSLPSPILSSLSLPYSLLSIAFPSRPSSPSLSLEVGPLKSNWRSWERCNGIWYILALYCCQVDTDRNRHRGRHTHFLGGKRGQSGCPRPTFYNPWPISHNIGIGYKQ